ncbi:MAG: hypothetical protein ABJI00_18375 [Paracoccaceae bacterium]
MAATDLLDMFTIKLAGKHRPTAPQLKLLLIVGARQTVVGDLIKYMKDGNILVCKFQLAREAAFSQPNIDTYPSDGSVPEEVLKTMLTPEDPCNVRGRASGSYTNDRREYDIARTEANADIASADDMIVEEVTAEDGKAYIIDTFFRR